MARKRRDNTYGPAGMPELSNPVDDNQLLAASAQAADQDRMSGAYDEFLFSENGLEQMPYERAVDDRLSLVQVRLLDRGRRAALLQHHALLAAESKVVEEAQKVRAISDRRETLEVARAEQVDILKGEKPGLHGLLWPGTAPEQTSLFSGAIHLVIPIAVFILVGGVDIFVIVNSFNKTGMEFGEALMFSAPTLGVQLVFPHLVGDRIRLMMHKHPRKAVNAIEASVLTVIWLLFALVLTVIRVNYVAEENAKIDQAVLDVLAFGVFFMLIGLGSWLLLMAARSNPHERIFARLNFAIQRLSVLEVRRKANLAKAQAQIPALKASLDVAEQGYKDAVDSARFQLAEAAKSIYRRALVNQIGDVRFSASYLGAVQQESSPPLTVQGIRSVSVRDRTRSEKRASETLASDSETEVPASEGEATNA